MTLLVTVFAAIISTLVWYCAENRKEMKLRTLALMYWGASIMWLIDAVYEYAELGAAYFTPEAADMLNDFYLGLSVAALGLVIWLVMVLVKDPKGVVRATLIKKVN